MKRLMLSLLAVAFVAGCCCRAGNGRVKAVSPDGRNEIRLAADGDSLVYEVLRDGVAVVAKTEIGMRVDGAKLFKEGDAAAMKVSCGEIVGCEKTPVYKKDAICLAAKTAFADFGDWGVSLIARNDGVAYRFELKKPGTVRIDCEKAEVTIPSLNAECWANFTGAVGCEETVPHKVAAKDLQTAKDGASTMFGSNKMIYLPFMYTVGGKTVVVTESDVRDYPIWNLTRHEKDDDDVELESLFARWPKKTFHEGGWGGTKLDKGGRWVRVAETEDYLVKTSGMRTFPWRTFVLADEPAKLCEADIVRALATPADAEADFSWVKPGKVAWDWWNCFDNQGNAGCNTKTYERFIDFAAKTGVEYVIFDEGWSEALNIWKFHPNVDVPHLIGYANKKGVGIILWMAWAQVYGEEEKVASHFAKLGAKGFKVDFMDRGDAEVANFLEKFAAACAKEKMLLDYHGVYRPTGMERMYPNILNYEGIHGLEQMKWYDGRYDMVTSDVREFYLRLTAGPMDYTPGAMLNYPVGGDYTGSKAGVHPGAVGTRCRQMAMMALYEAPLQMLCDSPTNYEKNMECFSFMAATPVVWKNTVALGGTPDTVAACARQAKDGAWYASGIAAAITQDFAFDTTFLGAGEWKAEFFRDAPDTDKMPMKYVHETKTVKAGERISLRMAPGGGFIVRFTK